KGDIRVTILGFRRRRPAHLKAVVDPESLVSSGIFEDRDRGHYAFAILRQLRARRNLHQVQIFRQEEEQERRHGRKCPTPPCVWCPRFSVSGGIGHPKGWTPNELAAELWQQRQISKRD